MNPNYPNPIPARKRRLMLLKPRAQYVHALSPVQLSIRSLRQMLCRGLVEIQACCIRTSSVTLFLPLVRKSLCLCSNRGLRAQTSAMDDHSTAAPNPFWSEETRRQFMESSQIEERSRPVDLERYEQRQTAAEQLQTLEPPYEEASAEAGMGQRAQQVLDASSSEELSEQRGRGSESPIPTVAKMETHVDESPDRYSQALGSEVSARTATSKLEPVFHEAVFVARGTPSEPELLPERRAESEVDKHEVRTDPYLSAGDSALFPVEQVIQRLGGMVQQALQEQVAPTLTQMMVQQAKVESRLEQLEMSSRAPSVDEESVAERTRLLQLSEPPRTSERGTDVRNPTDIGVASSWRLRGIQATIPEEPGVYGGPIKTELEEKGDKSNELRVEGEEKLPSQGVVWMQGVPYAWQVTPEGLELVPYQGHASPPGLEKVKGNLFQKEEDRGRRDVSVAEVLRERAASPFKEFSVTKSDPGEVTRAEGLERRALRPTTSDPLRGSFEPFQDRSYSPPKGWVAAEQLASRNVQAPQQGIPGFQAPPQGIPGSQTPLRGIPGFQAPPQGIPGSQTPLRGIPGSQTPLQGIQASHTPMSGMETPFVGMGASSTTGRTTTPVKPRIVYPQSPGETEIRPPPSRGSPKKSPKSSVSPSRPKPPPLVDASTAPTTDIQRLATALETAFKSGRSSDIRVEDVKTIPELPKLEIKEGERDLMPLIAGDWLAVIGPSLRDLSAQATTWWTEAVGAAQTYYTTWLESSPVDRLLLRPERPTRFDTGPFTRVEQRAVALLIKAIPGHIREDVVAMRRLTTIDIIGTILTTFQPGGLRERSALLKFLTTPEAAKSTSEALKGVRRWARWSQRASELHVAIPDATLLVAGLDVLTSGVIAQFPEAHFRLQTFRHQNNVDHVPSQEKAMSLGRMLQAELQTLEHSGPSKRSKLARVQEPSLDSLADNSSGKGGKGDPKGKGSGKKGGKEGRGADTASDAKACYHWLTKSGCKMGKECRFAHDRAALSSAPDVASRCYVCSGVGHRAVECPTTNVANPGDEKGKGGKANGKASPKGQVVKRVDEDKTTSIEQAKLLTAATQLLEQMQAKAIYDKPELMRIGSDDPRMGD